MYVLYLRILLCKAMEWEEWKVHSMRDGKVAFQAWTGKFLSAKPGPDGLVIADAEAIGEWETWSKVDSGDDTFVGLLSHFDMYLTCDDFHNCGKLVTANRSEMDVWEQWSICDDPFIMTTGACVICLDASRTHVFVPCGHVCVCDACSQNTVLDNRAGFRILQCPICRGYASQVIRLFFS